MKTYDPAPEHVADLLKAVLKRFYSETLEAVDLTVDLIYASSDTEAPAVSLGSYPCLAVVRIMGPKDRAMGRGDAEIVIDRDAYEKLDDNERTALLDHELYHLELKTDDFGKPEFDDHQRPKLKMRLHDHQFGWFDAIAKRHGDASQEVQQAQAFSQTSGQLYFELPVAAAAA
jgi:hypothetical protein